jgi:hypothetical protein
LISRRHIDSKPHQAERRPQFRSVFDKPEYHIEKVHVATNTQWHLNAAGYDVIVARTLPQVVEALAKAKSERKS